MKTKMKARMKINIITAFTLFFGFVGCEEYEDYIKDYDYSAVYFAAQQPVRTLVSRTGIIIWNSG